MLPIEGGGWRAACRGKGSGRPIATRKIADRGCSVTDEWRGFCSTQEPGGDVDQARAQHIEKLARARMSGTASAAQGTAAAWRKRRPTWLDSLTACHAMIADIGPPTAADVQDRRRPYPGH
jgi:hypothetical protein